MSAQSVDDFIKQSQLAKVNILHWIDTSVVKRLPIGLIKACTDIFVLAKNATMKAHEKFVHGRNLIMAPVSNVRFVKHS